MKTRNDYLQNFLKKHHINQEQITWLSGDASKRRYARIKKNNKTYILMDSPLPEKPKEFCIVDKILRRYNLPAPRIYKKDLRHGFMLLEDFGSCPMSKAVTDKKKADDLYILALDTLIHVQKSVKEYPKLNPAYPVLLKETLLFTKYYIPKIAKIHLSETANQEFRSIWIKLLQHVDILPKAITLYDYHVDNLMVKADGSLGLLDFQDAMNGPLFYDLVSLVQDERHPLPKKKQQELLDHYFELWPVLASPKYRDWLDVVAAHRHTRIMGIFARLATEYGNPNYLKYIPVCWQFLIDNLKSPLLKDYKDWLTRYMPKYLKRNSHK